MEARVDATLREAVRRLTEGSERYLLALKVLGSEIVREVERPYSALRFIRFSLPEGERLVVLKTPRHPLSPQKRPIFARDYEVPARLVQIFRSQPGLGLPAPVAYFEDLAVIAQEAVPGESLSSRIHRYGRLRPGSDVLAELKGHCEGAGRWLRVLHDSHRDAAAPLDITKLRHDVRCRLEVVSAADPSNLDPACCKEILQVFDAAAGSVGPEDLKTTLVHGDFALGNILVDGDRVTVIDFSRTASGSAFQDLARFHHQLRLFLAKFIYRQKVVAELALAFRKGYRCEGWEETPLFRIFTLRHILTHWKGRVSSRGRSLRERIYHRILRRWHRREIDRLLRGE